MMVPGRGQGGPMNTNKRIILAAGVLAAVISSGIIFVLTRESESEKAMAFQSDLQNSTSAANELYNRYFRTHMSVQNVHRLIQQMGFSREALVTHYQYYFRYPHSSRPLNEDMTDVTSPFQMRTSPVPVFPKGQKDSTGRPQYSYQFHAPKFSIAGDQSFIAWLKVDNASNWSTGRESAPERGSPVEPQIISAKILSDIKTGRVEIGTARYNDAGTDGDERAKDGIYTFSWKPAEKSRISWGELTLHVTFKVGDQEIEHDLAFSCTPRVPALFTGLITEELRDGSLIIKPEVSVLEPGYYIFEANLYHKETQKPTHFVNRKINLPAGTRDIELLFFGKIFHDKELAGKFVMKDLRGFRHNMPVNPDDILDFKTVRKTGLSEDRAKEKMNEPLHQFMVPYEKEYVTAEYDIDKFSSKEYEGEDKRLTFEGLERLKGQIPETAGHP